ncbi:MAG: beta-glucosidase [Chitinophagaceae bacterium BSSC1]|nr:MAG: beta-glucosidase [Chitinophagaceae bacterium BSSC1]
MKNFIQFICLLLMTQLGMAQNAYEAKAKNLLAKMTIEEKIGQLNLVTPGGGMLTGAVVSADVESKIKKGQVGGLFGIYSPEKVRKAQDLAVKGSRLHIPLIFGLDVIHGHKTIFPIPLGMSASWDLDLIKESSVIAAKEATADGLNWAFSPMVDIARDARWGRISEGSGEDPFLGGLIAKAVVQGYQGKDLSLSHTMMACVKHFALYGGAEAGREYNTVDMSKIKMYEYYLPPYKAAIDAGAGSIMSSFNEIDGVPATGNKWLLTDLLRKQWGFKGFVVSDYTSLNEMTAHGMGDLQTVSALALNAGLDMDMVGEGLLTTLGKSLKEGKVSLAAIDQACLRILEAKYKLGLFDDPFKYIDEARPAKDILVQANRDAARKMAAHSMVLLKNDQQLLPLKTASNIALIGPLADNKRNMLGTWVVAGDWTKSISVKEGLTNALGNQVNIRYAKGANISDDTTFAKRVNVFGTEIDIDTKTPEQLIKEAVDAAKQSDVVVAVMGEAADMSGESSSRADIGLPESQQKLLTALAQTGKPIVLVLINGRPLTLVNESKQATAILEAWAPGTEAGNAIADVLLGKYNPSGKITATFPRSVGQIPIYYNHKNTGRPYDGTGFPKFKSNYLDESNDPLYPFGYGLSYTSFTYSPVKLSKTQLKGQEKLMASIIIQNTGKYAGEEVVQMYISDPVASVARSVKDLKGFQKIALQPGETKEIKFEISTEELSFYNSDLKKVWEPGQFLVHIGTNSSQVQSATFNWNK